MKRLHVHLHVNDLAHSVRFYNALFGAAPAKLESDYAKWMLDDPRVNFAISPGVEAGLSHLGIEVNDDAELVNATQRALNAAGCVLEEKTQAAATPLATRRGRPIRRACAGRRSTPRAI